jgi:DNA (cytosine-5)-methyltransferase 1
MNGKKGRLYSLLTSALAALQPKVLVFENVQGLLSADDGVLHRTILDDWQTLGEGADHGNPEQTRSVLGYEILFAKVVDAVRFGVPQTRKRFIVIGLRLDLAREIGRAKLGRLRRWLSVEMSGGRSLTARFPLTCLEALEGKPLSDLAARYREVMLAYKGLWEDARLPTAAVWRRNVWDRLTLQVKRDYLRANQIDPRGATSKQFDKAMAEHEALLQQLGWLNKPLQGMEFGDATNVVLIQPSVQERMSRIPPGENHAFVAGTPWNVEGKGISFIYRRSFPLRPAFTVLAYGGGGTYGYHYARDRAQLTLRERARIQTFPDDFVFSGSSPAVRAQIGEAVPPLMAERIALMVREILSVVN